MCMRLDIPLVKEVSCDSPHIMKENKLINYCNNSANNNH